MKALFLVWAPLGFRADELAQILNAERVNITFLYGPRYFAPLRYLALFFRTLLILSSRRPDVIYAQNPPVFCPLTCLLYCKVTGTPLVVDHHSIWKVKTLGGGPISRVIGFFEAMVARSAYANTAPHRFWAEMLSRMKAKRVITVHDYVPPNENARDEVLRREFVAPGGLLAISSHGGHPLERMEVEASAARTVKGVTLVITGPREKLERRLSAAGLPANVRYAGFLERSKYERLKASADFAINITDEPYTLSHVILEFAASSLPVISSRQATVEELFADAIMYADSNIASASEKIQLMIEPSTRAEYRQRLLSRYEQLRNRHGEEVSRLLSLLATDP